MSNGEKMIYKILQEMDIYFHQEKMFPDLRHKGFLRLDFYFELVDHRSSTEKRYFAIEYDGPQHYSPVDFFGGVTAYEKTKIRDEIKNKWCEKNKVCLLRVTSENSYRQVIEFIQQMITQ